VFWRMELCFGEWSCVLENGVVFWRMELGCKSMQLRF